MSSEPTIGTVNFGEWEGSSFVQAWTNPLKLDIIHILDEGGRVVWWLTWDGLVETVSGNDLFVQQGQFVSEPTNQLVYDFPQDTVKSNMIFMAVDAQTEPASTVPPPGISIVSSAGNTYDLIESIVWDVNSRRLNVYQCSNCLGGPEEITANFTTTDGGILQATQMAMGEWVSSPQYPTALDTLSFNVTGVVPGGNANSGSITPSDSGLLTLGVYGTAELGGIIPTDDSVVRAKSKQPATSEIWVSDGVQGNEASADFGTGQSGPGTFVIVGVFGMKIPVTGRAPTQQSLLAPRFGPDFVTAVGLNSTELDTLQIVKPQSGQIVWHLDADGVAYID